MSENTSKEDISGMPLTRDVIEQMLQRNFDRLPDTERKIFTYGPVYLGANASFVGLIANSLFRRALNVKPALIASSVPMAVLPFLATTSVYHATVCVPLMLGDLNCPSCVLMRSALVGVVGGGLYPILLAIPVNISLAAKYATAPMPEKATAFRYFVDLCKPILRKMRAVLVLQAFFGTYLGSKHSQTYMTLAEMTFGSVTED